MEANAQVAALTRDLIAADGTFVAARGQRLDTDSIRDAALKAPHRPERVPLFEAKAAEPVLAALDALPLAHMVSTTEARSQVAEALAQVRLPKSLWLELEALEQSDEVRFQHAIWSAVVSARMFHAALGDAPGIARLAGAALVHDLGMRYTAPRLRWHRDALEPEDAEAVRLHPLVGSMLIARLAGDGIEARFALLHHARPGQGYPRMRGAWAVRGLDVLAVASAFSALVAPRSYRDQPFNARGAVDQLVDDAEAGRFDTRAIRLLVHCLRGTQGALPADLQLTRRSTGFRPEKNHHGIAPLMSRNTG